MLTQRFKIPLSHGNMLPLLFLYYLGLFSNVMCRWMLFHRLRGFVSSEGDRSRNYFGLGLLADIRYACLRNVKS